MRRIGRAFPGAAIGALLLHLTLTQGAVATGSVALVSVTPAGTPGNAASLAPGISSDGSYVAFTSSANNLVPNDTNGTDDVFVRDLHTGATERVSISDDELQSNDASFGWSISGDGRFVAFYSGATNLVTNDSNAKWDVFVRDRQNAETLRVSVDSFGGQSDGPSESPVISRDGSAIAFQSGATNLVPDDGNGRYDVFVHFLATGMTEVVSADESGVPGNAGAFRPPAISADGRYVAFISHSHLISSLSNEGDEVYVRDTSAHTTELISVTTSGTTVGNGVECSDPGISANGRHVSFWCPAPNLVAGDTNGYHHDAFVRDRLAQTTDIATRNSSGQQTNAWGDEGDDDGVGGPAISDDGRFISFLSNGANLVSGDTNDLPDVFRRDMVDGITVRASDAGDGTQGNSFSSYQLGMTADGGLVAFQSHSSNLIAGDTNGADDVFTTDLSEAPLPSETPQISPTPPAPMTPSAPLNVTAAAGDGQASVSWSRPLSDGGSALSTYEINGSSTAGSTLTVVNANVTSASVGGLTNGADYTFTVTATNGVGSGPPSAPSDPVTAQAGAPPPQTVGESVPSSGGSATTDSGSGPSASDPLTTSITVPATEGGGAVTIAETAVSETPPTGGYQFLGQQVDITSTAPTSASNPLTIVFTIDDSLLLAATGMTAPPPAEVDITRSEGGSPAVIPDCTVVVPALALDPCISDRTYVSGDLRITVLTSTASHWNGAVSPVSVDVTNTGYSPKSSTVRQGDLITWTFGGTRAHSATDNLKLGPAKSPLFNSGALVSGRYGTSLAAAGTYTYGSIVKGDPGSFAGSIVVPVRSSATTGGPSTQFRVTWSSAQLNGYVYDVRYRFMKAGGRSWAPYFAWRTGSTALNGVFVPPSGNGTYAFSARLRNANSGMAAGWSPEILLLIQ